ncbi:MAG: DctP family TRAP transporter solute-binding subunit [Acidaminobacter sp.]|uniref:TRAP transporter substrate-binding protein n=1 Tax=Acidaminobacter sp. TaxID=1872102 RepID=UPI001381F98F|nr:TRAP transporter substrate-binding protein [Acidaminobacter sp.]MZQ99410.1 DctP family TRAP transporter solute-binding subunit [Acidaminobacter sp.]
MKKLVALLLSLVLVFSLAACGSNSAPAVAEPAAAPEPATEKVTIKIATVISGDSSPTLQALNMFKENIEAKSQGHIEVQLFPGGQLGTAIELMDQARNGDIQMTTSNPLTVNTTITELATLDQYFLFDDSAHAYRFFDSEGGQYLLDTYQQMGLQGLGYFPLGFRQMTNSKKPINTMEDFKGLKIRGYNPVQIAVWESVGCNLSSVAWGELFSALQQNLIDGQEGAITSFSEARFYEVQKYVTLTNHMFSTDVLVANQEFMASLSDEDRAMVESELATVFAWQQDKVVTSTQELIDSIAADYGVEFNEIPAETLAKMKEIMAPITEENIVKISGREVFDKVMAYVEEVR